MNSFLEKIQKEKNYEYLIYAWYSDVYQWKKLTEEEYNNTKNQLSEIQVATLTSQVCYLDTFEIINNIYTGRDGYDMFEVRNGEITEWARRVIKESLAISGSCSKITLSEDQKKLFINTPFAKIFDKNLNHVSDHFYNPETKISFKKSLANNTKYDELVKIEGIKDLPEPYCREINPDLIELIATEKIRFGNLGYIDGRPVLHYYIKNK